MEYSAAIAEKSRSREEKYPFPRAFAIADPYDASGKAFA
jgi:hypothetical protein